MPIKLNNAQSVAKAAKNLYNAKFFNKDITGSGKATGLINQSIYPANLPPKAPTNSHTPHWHIRNEVSKYVRLTTYPLNPLGSYEPIGIKGAVNIEPTFCKFDKNGNIFLRMLPMAVTISEPIATAAANTNTTNNIQTGKKCAILYRIDIIEKDGTIIDMFYTENPVATMHDYHNRTNFRTVAGQNVAGLIDMNNVDAYLNGYDTYYEICKQSEIWQTSLIDVIIKAFDADPNNFPMDKIVRYIAQYKVTLQQYKSFYAELTQRFTAQTIKAYTKMNTSLLLQDTLSNLSQVQFDPLPAPGQNGNTLDLSWTSKEQFDAITSAAPLNQVQAGAGTGKSTVIKARLDYLHYLGIDPSDIMVLSFTNAAADNIKARCPHVQSMTIAKMIDTIYQTNHPTHQLSPSMAKRGEGSTFTNSLELYKDGNPLVAQLIDATNRVEKYNDYATLLRLVEENYNDIIAILDTAQQTTFHLEIIICYLEHATMTIPFNIKHLLIDEVQDNAVFEFIFFLNLTCKLKNHLYLVGDCSQTLYEFRASDPKALNAIEASGLFASFPLNVNYRSNQDILQFANALLTDIEANQYANIQLQSFKLNQITKQSFKDAVVVDYNRLAKISDLEDWIRSKLRSPEMKKWIEDKFSKGEQICVLCYKRREAAMFQKELEKLYPSRKLVSIIPVKNTSFAYLSKYVSHCHQQLLALPTSTVHDLCTRVRAEVIANLQNCHITPTMSIYPVVVQKIQTMLTEWEQKNSTMLNDELIRFKTNIITHQRFAEIVGESLINFEIQKNALKQTMLSQKNATKKEDTDNADFIFSTIHSAKGLEFDNVILLYANKNQMEEDDKRMYYVGLTRAKKKEYVLSFDTVLNPLILSRYDTVLQHLPDAAGVPGAVAGVSVI